MPTDNRVLEEWKERYESYRQYRTQALALFSFVSTVWLIGLGLAMGSAMPYAGKISILVALTLGVISLIAAHVIAIRAIHDLGLRLKSLENELKISAFRTTWPLETGLKFTFAISLVALSITIALAFAVAFGKL